MQGENKTLITRQLRLFLVTAEKADVKAAADLLRVSILRLDRFTQEYNIYRCDYCMENWIENQTKDKDNPLCEKCSNIKTANKNFEKIYSENLFE